MKKYNLPWMTVFLSFLLSAGSALIFSVASGQQPANVLVDGPGADLVRLKCSLCHDLGNITRIRQTREEWEETVRTMIRRGAPISPEEMTVIVDYCTKYYGK